MESGLLHILNRVLKYTLKWSRVLLVHSLPSMCSSNTWSGVRNKPSVVSVARLSWLACTVQGLSFVLPLPLLFVLLLLLLSQVSQVVVNTSRPEGTGEGGRWYRVSVRSFSS